MGNYENDSNPEHNWEEGWEATFSWNEFNWEQYLRAEGDEVAKYQTLYNKLARSANRLDEVALFMGWQQSPAIQSDDAETPGFAEENNGPEQPKPYTLHKHPLFIANKALHGWLIEKWGQHAALCSEQISTSKALALQASFMDSDYHGLLAVTALDMDDFSLAIAYFKRGMVSINKALSLLAELESTGIEPLPLYAKHARVRLFDIREIWLRVSSDCRATIASDSDDD